MAEYQRPVYILGVHMSPSGCWQAQQGALLAQRLQEIFPTTSLVQCSLEIKYLHVYMEWFICMIGVCCRPSKSRSPSPASAARQRLLALLPRGPPDFLLRAYDRDDPLPQPAFEDLQDEQRNKYGYPRLKRRRSRSRSVSRSRSRTRARSISKARSPSRGRSR